MLNRSMTIKNNKSKGKIFYSYKEIPHPDNFIGSFAKLRETGFRTVYIIPEKKGGKKEIFQLILWCL